MGEHRDPICIQSHSVNLILRSPGVEFFEIMQFCVLPRAIGNSLGVESTFNPIVTVLPNYDHMRGLMGI